MGREVRRVAADWVHPMNEAGDDWVALREWFGYDEEGIAELVAEGRADPSLPYYGMPMMPRWKPEERTHVQYYEATSEGTPLSPVFATVEELADWCFRDSQRPGTLLDTSSLEGGVRKPLGRDGWLRLLRSEYDRWEERRKLFADCEALGARAGR